ncbi:hypothetical protein [Mycobacterium seoulense]|uniref:Uncharacterized protein n=1 Tax=Mycobacterium seoulense TaxID=386911 RepID=A0A7I7NWT3_9MYCO|nr:hypothetical protein [Mycobacterium seoulense]MCV7436074.1 hypothetical protein [Mycobacterium seoulense]BBY01043.1 hypothetical protein MSEO_15420 [Mycobacterium seoulense]
MTDTTRAAIEPVAVDAFGDPVVVTTNAERLIQLRTGAATSATYLNPGDALALADALRTAAHGVLAAREAANR